MKAIGMSLVLPGLMFPDLLFQHMWTSPLSDGTGFKRWSACDAHTSQREASRDWIRLQNLRFGMEYRETRTQLNHTVLNNMFHTHYCCMLLVMCKAREQLRWEKQIIRISELMDWTATTQLQIQLYGSDTIKQGNEPYRYYKTRRASPSITLNSNHTECPQFHSCYILLGTATY